MGPSRPFICTIVLVAHLKRLGTLTDRRPDFSEMWFWASTGHLLPKAPS